MATLYAAADGRILHHRDLPYSDMVMAIPEHATQQLTFDAGANADLVAELERGEWGRYRVSGGVLTRDGEPVPVAGTGP